MYWYGHDMSGWGYAWMGIGMVLFWGLLLAAFVIAVRLLVRSDGRSVVDQRSISATSKAEDLLAERFSTGELNEEEYVHRLEVLRRHAATGQQRR